MVYTDVKLDNIFVNYGHWALTPGRRVLSGPPGKMAEPSLLWGGETDHHLGFGVLV